jgi:hypothetical protein
MTVYRCRVIGVTEYFGPVRGQKREHAPFGDQVPGYRRGVGQLPVRLLETLHSTIMLIEHRTVKHHPS